MATAAAAAVNTKSAPQTEIFMTHDWGVDEKGRKNHERVSIVNNRLRDLGYRTWFDEDYIHTDIQDSMVEGIDNTHLVLVHLTTRYMDKVNGGDMADNCRQEFLYSFRLRKKILCITMDPTMSRISNWEGLLLMTLGGCLFVRFDGDLEDEEYLNKQMEQLVKQLNLKGVKPLGEKTKGPKRDNKNSSKDVVRALPESVDKNYESRGIKYIDDLVRKGNVSTLASIIDAKKECLALRDKDGDTPLLLAAYYGQLESLKCLLGNGASFDDVANNGMTILHRSSFKGHVATTRYIVEQYKSLLQKKNNKGNTALHSAAQGGCEEIITTLISHGVDVGTCCNLGFTPVLIAAQFGQLGALKCLINNGASALVVTNDSRTALDLAAQSDRVDLVEHLLAHHAALLERASNNGWTPLHTAAFKGSLESLRLLLNAGANVYALTKKNQTPVDLAKRENKVSCVTELTKWYVSLDVVRALPESVEKNYESRGIKYIEDLVRKGNVSTLASIIDAKKECLALRDKDGDTPLLLAAYYGQLESLKCLLGNGASFDDVSNNGMTILHRSSFKGHVATTRYIVEQYKSLLQRKNNKGNTALHSAAQGGCEEIITTLISHGVDVGTCCNLGFTPVLIAAQFGQLGALKCLINNGASALVVTNDSRTALYLTAQSDRVDLVKHLLAHHAALLERASNNGWTPLHTAAFKGSLESLRLLLNTGANVYALTKKNETPVDLAKRENKVSCVTELTKWMKDDDSKKK